jgi:hypothetical protein
MRWTLSHEERPVPPPTPRPTVVIHKVADGPGRRVYRVERDGQSIVYIDDRGARVRGNHDVIIDTDNEAARVEADDNHDEYGRVSAEDLPVPVVPGSRVTEVRFAPPEPPAPPKPSRRPQSPRPPRRPQPPKAPATAAKAATREIEGRLSATKDRARDDARAQLERELTTQLAPQVPRDWKIPGRLVESMITQVTITPVVRDYGTVYKATLLVDDSPRKRAAIVAAYRHEQVVKRLVMLGAVLAFVLSCLAAISGYIKADEATKGYYTTKLRLAAAAGVGAAGVLIYQMFA